MSTATTTNSATIAPPPFEVPGPVTRVPSLDEIRELTSVPERRVVFRGVDWSFYEQLVDSIPETGNIHVDFDGKDLEVMGKGRRHERSGRLLGLFIDIVTSELKIRRTGLDETTWKRPLLKRGIEADRCYYFAPEKLAADAAASARASDDIADYPNPDLAVEVDISRPQVDRTGIYAALRVPEMWRFDGAIPARSASEGSLAASRPIPARSASEGPVPRAAVVERRRHAERACYDGRFDGAKAVIDHLADDGTYQAAEKSMFMPVNSAHIERWVLVEDSGDELAWEERLRAWVRSKLGSAAPGGAGMTDVQDTVEPFSQTGETDS
jgi:Uma2 family endonuclease